MDDIERGYIYVTVTTTYRVSLDDWHMAYSEGLDEAFDSIPDTITSELTEQCNYGRGPVASDIFIEVYNIVAEAEWEAS